MGVEKPPLAKTKKWVYNGRVSKSTPNCYEHSFKS